MVPGAGIEPARLAAGDFESPASTNFTTRAACGTWESRCGREDAYYTQVSGWCDKPGSGFFDTGGRAPAWAGAWRALPHAKGPAIAGPFV